MAKTQVNEKQIKNRILTGASFHPSLNVYDETKNYSIGNQVIWKLELYTCNTNITGTTEGNLSTAPDISSNWDLQPNAIYGSYPSSSQTISTSRTTLTIDTERQTSPYFTLSGGVITCNSSGTYIISLNISLDNTSGTRRTGVTYIQIDTGSGFNDIPNAELYNYSRTSQDGKDTSALTIPVQINTNDKLRVQIISPVGTELVTYPSGCNFTIFGIDTISGPQGIQGLTGAPGDLNWTGTYSSGTYNTNDVVEYQGSSYVSTSNGNSTTPPSSDWDLVAQKGSAGAGATVSVYQDTVAIPNTPHDSFNFSSPLTASDGGGGTANIGIILPKNTYMIPIWAEENAALSNNTYEWAFGNGANTGSTGGITVYVPVGYTAEVEAMSSTIRQGTADIELVLNGSPQGSSAHVSGGAGSNVNTFTPVSILSGDLINFRTLSASGTGGPNTITAYIKYKEI